jgi:hypothetical protein
VDLLVVDLVVEETGDEVGESCFLFAILSLLVPRFLEDRLGSLASLKSDLGKDILSVKTTGKRGKTCASRYKVNRAIPAVRSIGGTCR